MKNLLSGVALVLLAAVVVLLWRLENHAASLAEFARVQLADRAESHRVAREQALLEQRAAEASRAEATRLAEAKAAAESVAAQRVRDEAARDAARAARLAEPVKPGEIVPEIVLDNHEAVRNAVVVAVQASSVSFKAGSRLYNLPTEQLPEELRLRVRRMFPAPEESPRAP
ncbi:MAG TPA: hypothetical protein VK178_01900 [Opitutaceae bacterium]|nr:hypothetical protein [Opitutaceae bacterium]